ncbi:MAG: ComF family protein [Acidobacteriota bacterium]|nr:ComF family protein [Acidobacteriota bacterium]
MISSLKNAIFSTAKFAELIFFPSYCQLCSELLELPHEKVICRNCWENLHARRSSFCIACGRFFEGPGSPHVCADCLNKRPSFSIHRSCGMYQGKLKDVILLYKYRKFSVLGKGLAAFAYKSLGKEMDLWWDVEAIVPVPLHPKREKIRGFNQAQIVAKELAKYKGIELLEKKLIRVKNIPPQTSLEASERKKNVRGAFAVKNGESLKGKIILLVDDVYTTGATIKECSLALKKAGAREVRAITLAQV